MSSTNTKSSVLVIGGGNLAQSIIRGAIAAGVLSSNQVHVVDRHPEKCTQFPGITSSSDIAAARDWFFDRGAAAEILLAVKPQTFAATIDPLRPFFEQRRVILISVLAGIQSEVIFNAFGPTASVIRVMTNTPTRVGRGMTAISRGAGSVAGDENLAVTLFSAVGAAVQLSEPKLDVFMALAASGPAYLLYFAEALARAAQANGLPPDVANLAARETLIGTGLWLANENASPAELRRRVTTPGGVTAAALSVFDGVDISGVMDRAIKANMSRSTELGRNATNITPATSVRIS